MNKIGTLLSCAAIGIITQNSAANNDIASTLQHVTGTLFQQDNNNVEFSCSAGGEPIAIWSNSIVHPSWISSKNDIAPAYVAPGLSGISLKVSEDSMSDDQSKTHLTVKNPNPGDSYHKLQFGVRSSNGVRFYVNSVNFASIDSAQVDRFVSVFNLKSDEKDLFQSTYPSTQPNFIADTGVLVYKFLPEITATVSSWNQLTPWQDASHTVQSHIKYNFIPQKVGSLNFEGYGFWICGRANLPETSETTSAQNLLVPKSTNPIYYDLAH